MKQITILTMALALIFSNILNAEEHFINIERKLNEEQNLPRIYRLLPDLTVPFEIEPRIPENFVVRFPYGEELGLNEWIYWGPKDVLEHYIKNGELKEPVIRIQLSTTVVQTGPHTFTDEGCKIPDPSYKEIKLNWGLYPVLAAKAKIQGRMVFIAWAGLNDPYDKTTLIFNLVYPENQEPDAKALDLWFNFLKNTKEIKYD